MGVRRAFQLADIPVEGNEIVGQEFAERINAATELPPHGAQGTQDRNEGGKFCPVHGSAIADSRRSGHIGSLSMRLEDFAAGYRRRGDCHHLG